MTADASISFLLLPACVDTPHPVMYDTGLRLLLQQQAGA